jgi:hypothetical protein
MLDLSRSSRADDASVGRAFRIEPFVPVVAHRCGRAGSATARHSKIRRLQADGTSDKLVTRWLGEAERDVPLIRTED